MADERSPAFRFALLIAALLAVTASVSYLAWYASYMARLFQVDIEEVRAMGGNLCPVPLYDINGNGYQGQVRGHAGTLTYSGPAPLYAVDPERFPPNPTEDACWYPATLPPALVREGRTVYPLLLAIELSDNRLRSGESTKLTAKATFLDTYPAEPPENAVLTTVPMTIRDRMAVSMLLQTTKFDFTPSNAEAATSTLGLAWPTEQTWIIAPASDALGTQWLSARLYDAGARRYLAVAYTKILVRDLSGLSPALIAAISAAGTFAAGLFGLIKLVPEAWSSLRGKGDEKDAKPPLGFKLPET
jgi:hypothetical protein